MQVVNAGTQHAGAAACGPAASSGPEDVGEPNPWQKLPPCLGPGIVVSIVCNEPHWPLIVGQMRLVCYDWYVTVAEALPLLLPPELTPAGVGVRRIATLMPGFPALRMLRIKCTDGLTIFGALDRAWAACCCLQHLSIFWHDRYAVNLGPLTALRKLRTLVVISYQLHLDSAGLEALRQLPQLERLALAGKFTPSSELSGLTRLTSLDVSARRLGSDLGATLVQLSRLCHLGLEGLTLPACSSLSQLISHTSLTSLTLQSNWHSHDLQQAAVPLLAFLLRGPHGDGKGALPLRRLQLQWMQDLHAAPLRLSMLSRPSLESLALMYCGLEAFPTWQLSCLEGLTDLDILVGAKLEANADGIVVSPGDLVTAVGSYLTALRTLRMRCCDEVQDAAFTHLSRLSSLTSLAIERASELKREALASLLALTGLQSLALEDTSSIDADSLEAAGTTGGKRSAILLPNLTRLSLDGCSSLSNAALVQFAAALPALRHLSFSTAQPPTRQHLHYLLQRCRHPRLLQSSWVPTPAPAPRPEGTLLLSDQEWEQQQRHEEDAAFYQAWRLCLHTQRKSAGGYDLFEFLDDLASQHELQRLLLL